MTQAGKIARGQMAYHAGLAAEEQVLRHYQLAGHRVCARRFRSAWGEIDLVLRNGDEVIFVEVKRGRSHAEAAQRLSARQIDRIFNTAMAYVANEPLGQNTLMRFDVALVDGMGRIEVLEQALAA